MFKLSLRRQYSTFTTCRTADPEANYPDAAGCKCLSEYAGCLDVVKGCGNYATVQQERIAGLCTAGCTCTQCNKANEDKFSLCETTRQTCEVNAGADTAKSCTCISDYLKCVATTLPADFAAKCLEGRVMRGVDAATTACEQKKCASCTVAAATTTTTTAGTTAAASAGATTTPVTDDTGHASTIVASIATIGAAAIMAWWY